ncbi:unnamed protein product, partial [Acidithrix sp. C25]
VTTFDRNGLEMLTGQECLDLLESRDFGRIGLSVNALPAILPVNYRFVDGVIIVLSASGAKLSAATNKSVVAFEVDEYSSEDEYGWSVLAIGVAFRLDEEPTLISKIDNVMEVWIDADSASLLGIRPDIISGRRISGPKNIRAFGR